jgi:uncharacterized protein (TIRG00374 family)
VLLAAMLFLFRGRIHFDWLAFMVQLRGVSVPHVMFGIGLIYTTFWLRAVRWAVLVAPTKRVRVNSLVGAQFIGFSAVALFGRLADLTRPYLLARRTGLSVESQVAVYTVERMFDLASAAVIFSSALAFGPRDLPQHETYIHVGVFSLLATLALAAFAVTVRLAGDRVAHATERMLHGVSPNAGREAGAKILGFRDGLRAISSAREFAVALLLSLVIWGMIAYAYVQTAHAFTRTPELAGLTFSRTMLLMAASIGGGLVQLPVIGWFTSITATAAAMHTFYGAPMEAATACGAVLLVVLTLSIVPVGMVFARVEGLSLKQAAEESETAERTHQSDTTLRA